MQSDDQQQTQEQQDDSTSESIDINQKLDLPTLRQLIVADAMADQSSAADKRVAVILLGLCDVLGDALADVKRVADALERAAAVADAYANHTYANHNGLK